MTDLLEQAFHTAAQLPPDEQDAFAKWMLHELASEQRWNELFAKSQDMLAKMAEEALAEDDLRKEFVDGDTIRNCRT